MKGKDTHDFQDSGDRGMKLEEENIGNCPF